MITQVPVLVGITGDPRRHNQEFIESIALIRYLLRTNADDELLGTQLGGIIRQVYIRVPGAGNEYRGIRDFNAYQAYWLQEFGQMVYELIPKSPDMREDSLWSLQPDRVVAMPVNFWLIAQFSGRPDYAAEASATILIASGDHAYSGFALAQPVLHMRRLILAESKR